MLLAFFAGSSRAEVSFAAGQTTNLLEIRSVVVDGRSVPWHAGAPLLLKPFPKNISFDFGHATNASRAPIRLRYKLEGYDTTWHEGGGEMNLVLRFLDDAGDLIALKTFKATGDSAGWNGALESATLAHRRETLIVPPGASRLQAVISSAGPPSTVGIFVVDDLVVSRLSPSNRPAVVLLRSPFGQQTKDEPLSQVPQGWIRDGTRPSMAIIVELGRDPRTRAFAILDEDGLSHAEWRNLNDIAPKVVPGEQLLVEWNELFTIGASDVNSAFYGTLPDGDFRFRVAEATPLGISTGAEASLRVRVPPPFWRMPWFWGLSAILVMAASVASGRYFTWYRMRREVLRLKQQRLLEQERLRIAQNIHDDLGARVTQISLLSGMAQESATLPEKARADFASISSMSRELVSALYETVWAVNPENDNLDALGNYLCQMINQLCNQAQLRCRLHVLDLPRDVQVSSQTRHNIIMAVKEAVHNVIKHAHASEVTLLVDFTGRLLTVSIQDDGGGFQQAGDPVGNGLTNMKRRLADIGGDCSIESQAGRGTTVRMRLEIRTNT
jgi:signal transduction histidine kinase